MIIEIVTSQIAFVAVGTDTPTTTTRSIAYSIDGIGWTTAATNGFSGGGNGVAYSSHQNKWIAVGAGTVNTLAWSPDGMTWIGLGRSLFPATGNGIAYSEQQNRWVAVGAGTNSIHYSTDGFSWTVVTPSIFTLTGNAVVYSSERNQWVAVGQGLNFIAVSSDGISWTGLGRIIFANEGMGVRYGNGLYVSVGIGTLGQTISQAWSSDGVNWTPSPEQMDGLQRSDAVYAQNRWILVGQGPRTFHNSTEGKSWTQMSSFAGMGNLLGITHNVAYNRYVAVGFGTNTIIHSSDGNNWNSASLTGQVFSDSAWKVATTNRLSQIITNATAITNNVINLVTNTSIVDVGTAITISGNLTVIGDLAVKGTWILVANSSVNVSGILGIKGNTTFNSLQPINCNSLTISSAIGDSKLEVPLNVNLTLGSSISYPVANYKDRVGVFSSITVRSASTVTLGNNDCPVATQDYSSSTLTVTVTMTRCSSPPIENFATNSMPTAMIVGIAVGCAVLAAVGILVVVLLMRRHRDRADAIANSNLKQASINDLKVAQNRHSPMPE